VYEASPVLGKGKKEVFSFSSSLSTYIYDWGRQRVAAVEMGEGRKTAAFKNRF
jgi:hypothetical protein